MFFVLGCLLVVVLSIRGFKKVGVRHAYSTGALLATGFSFLALVCLSQNYTQNLIPEINDGIGMANNVAYWIIGEDGWSLDLFRKTFEQSVYITLALLLAYPVIYMVESRYRSESKG